MPSNKLPNSQSLQELLEALKSEKVNNPEQIDNDSEDIYNFVSHFNIQPGDNKVKLNLLYSLYRNWSNVKLPKTQFSAKMTRYFINLSYHDQTFYLINQPNLKVSKALYDHHNVKVRDPLKVPNYKRHFDNYLSYYNIKPGTFYASSSVLYYLYDKWSYKNKVKRPIKPRHFFRFCKLYFKHKRKPSEDMEWFAVSKTVLEHITKDEIDEILKGVNEKRKTHKTWLRKVSRLKAGTKS